MDFDGRGGPGPGEYDPYAPVEKGLELVNAAGPCRETSRAFESKLPRYHEMVVQQEEKKVGLPILIKEHLRIQNALIIIFFL